MVGSKSAAEPIGVPLDELRQWTKEAVRRLGYGGQRELAEQAKIPDPALSRFRSGRSLPDHYRLALQQACGRVLPYITWKEAA